MISIAEQSRPTFPLYDVDGSLRHSGGRNAGVPEVPDREMSSPLNSSLTPKSDI